MKRVTNSNTVAQEEWDFYECPPEESHECYLWELSRNCDEIKRDVRQLRAVCREKTFDAIWRKFGRNVFHTADIFSPPNRRPYAIFYFCPEFPDQPYLCSASDEERQKRLKSVWGDDDTTARAQLLDARFGLLPDDIGRRIKMATTTEEPIYRVGSDDLALLNICWHKSNKWLMDDFAAWLEKNRNQEIKQWPDRGKGLPSRKDLHRLKQIGAWRLLQNMNWKTAVDFTQKTLGKPLYEKQSDWIEANKKVARWIKQQNQFHSKQP